MMDTPPSARIRPYPSIRSTCSCVLKEGSRLKFIVLLLGATCVLLLVTNGPHEKHMQELLWYARFGLWWVILGVASSIGLGSGLHTFVLYLGPHIALFTMKAVQCGRVDLKSAPYDTILLKRRPSWLEKDCPDFGPPIYQETIPFSKILHEVHLEAVLWGIGTALGELPPYFISRAASMSGQKVPNPLFDLAGILCGQFNVPFWKFFLATLIGKAIIKVYMQTTLVITLCNNQLLELVEERLSEFGSLEQEPLLAVAGAARPSPFSILLTLTPPPAADADDLSHSHCRHTDVGASPTLFARPLLAAALMSGPPPHPLTP
ncbi:hypothetical protein ZWY2020_024329 [Hordeum vulgare]|nr:hypothetical protein ZWY2020_024329 [Hordeum vulgare]